jgi:hypothetical protein
MTRASSDKYTNRDDGILLEKVVIPESRRAQVLPGLRVTSPGSRATYKTFAEALFGLLLLFSILLINIYYHNNI